jgi:LysR family transcriptional regulator, hydrogen peroxide-inducible genes activator
MRTLDIPRTIALLKPLTAAPDIAVRLVGIDETTRCTDRLQKHD